MSNCIDFSFCFPSRGVWKDVKKTLDSFERTTRKRDRLEVLIAFDIGTAEDLPDKIVAQHYGFKVDCFYVEKSDWFTRDYNNFLANKCSGENICMFNDDAWIKTVGWDDKIRKRIKDEGSSIYLLDIPDSARIKYGHNFPCFPMVSAKGVAAIGYFFNEKVKMYPSDKVLYEMYKMIDRVVVIDNVFIQHDHIIETDPSKNNLLQTFLDQRDNGELNIDVSEDVVTLLRAGNKDYVKHKSKLNKIIDIIKGEK